MCCRVKVFTGVGLLLLVGGIAAGVWWAVSARQQALAGTVEAEKATQKVKEADKAHPRQTEVDDHEWQLPNAEWMTPFADQVPISFVNRTQNAAEWAALKGFWNEVSEKAVDPHTGKEITRKAVRVKVPLGLTSSPPVPAENPMTVEKWKLGKQLYFDKILSSDRTVACATCHDPGKGFTDQSRFSKGISGKVGGMSAPTVFNAGYNALQFW